MSIFEYDEEKHMKSEREEWREIGHREGRDTLTQILRSLMEAGETEELHRVLSDSAYQEQLCQEYFLKTE